MLLSLTEGVQEQSRGSVSTYKGIEANENNFMMCKTRGKWGEDTGGVFIPVSDESAEWETWER